MSDRSVARKEDMSPSGRLQLYQQDDGDIIVQIVDDRSVTNSVEFCMPGSGGGGSPRTLRALRELALAMAEDNADSPNGRANISRRDDDNLGTWFLEHLLRGHHRIELGNGQQLVVNEKSNSLEIGIYDVMASSYDICEISPLGVLARPCSSSLLTQLVSGLTE